MAEILAFFKVYVFWREEEEGRKGRRVLYERWNGRFSRKASGSSTERHAFILTGDAVASSGAFYDAFVSVLGCVYLLPILTGVCDL